MTGKFSVYLSCEYQFTTKHVIFAIVRQFEQYRLIFGAMLHEMSHEATVHVPV